MNAEKFFIYAALLACYLVYAQFAGHPPRARSATLTIRSATRPAATPVRAAPPHPRIDGPMLAES